MGDVYEECVGGSLKLKGGETNGKIKKKKKTKNKAKEVLETLEKVEERVSSSSSGEGLTPAQKAFDKVLQKRQKERILKKAKKTHKQRVEELNAYMDSLSEHYDIPKVSWTK